MSVQECIIYQSERSGEYLWRKTVFRRVSLAKFKSVIRNVSLTKVSVQECIFYQSERSAVSLWTWSVSRRVSLAKSSFKESILGQI